MAVIHIYTVGGHAVGRSGREVWVSESGGTSHIPNDYRNIYDSVGV